MKNLVAHAALVSRLALVLIIATTLAAYGVPTTDFRTSPLKTSGNIQCGSLTVTGTTTQTGAVTFTGAITANNAGNVVAHANAGGLFFNPAGTFSVALTPSAEVANRVLTIPLLGGADTIMTLGTAQAVTGVKTFNDSALILKAGTGSETFLPSGTIYVTGTAVNTGANTNETDGGTKSVGGNTLSGNGKALRYRVWGTTAANANNKTVQLYWGGTSVYTTGAVAANAKPWFFEMTIIRTAAGAQTVLINGQFNGSAVAAVTTATKDETTALIVKNTMTNGTATASDCTTSGAMLEVLP